MTVPDSSLGSAPSRRTSPTRSLLNDPFIRGIVFQVLTVVAIVAFGLWIFNNAVENMRAANITSGFDFLWNRAGYDISQQPIPYSIDDTHGRAFLVSLLNTLIVAAIGVVLATVLGFLIGVARLSRNWLLAKLATVYIEIFRNLPLLLQLLFWYKAVLSVLPGPRQAYELPFGTFLSNRGFKLPQPIPTDGFNIVAAAFVAGIVATIVIGRWSKARQMATGQRFPVSRAALGLIVLLPLVIFVLAGAPLTFSYPELQGFNFVGGISLNPELLALLLGLVIYTAAFIAEIVRAGIMAISRGQTEAALSLGLQTGTTMRLVIIPQAMRVIIPPLTSQYLNLTKNSSLAIAVGYPDLVAVFAGSTLNITGRAVEVLFLTMSVYLVISLLTAAFMNWFNARVALVER